MKYWKKRGGYLFFREVWRGGHWIFRKVWRGGHSFFPGKFDEILRPPPPTQPIFNEQSLSIKYTLCTSHFYVRGNRGKSPTPGQISGGIDMEFPPMSPGIPRHGGGGAYIQMTSALWCIPDGRSWIRISFAVSSIIITFLVVTAGFTAFRPQRPFFILFVNKPTWLFNGAKGQL